MAEIIVFEERAVGCMLYMEAPDIRGSFDPKSGGSSFGN
jgi:hypothetical protein